MAREESTGNRVQWNNVRSSSNRLQTEVVGMPGKTCAEPETLQSIQHVGEMHSVWSDAELLAEGGVTQESIERRYLVHTCWQKSFEKMMFEELLKIVKAEVKLGPSFPTQELDAEFAPAPGPG